MMILGPLSDKLQVEIKKKLWDLPEEERKVFEDNPLVVELKEGSSKCLVKATDGLKILAEREVELPEPATRLPLPRWATICGDTTTAFVTSVWMLKSEAEKHVRSFLSELREWEEENKIGRKLGGKETRNS